MLWAGWTDKLIRLQNRHSLTRISESIIAQERSIYLSCFSESHGQDIINAADTLFVTSVCIKGCPLPGHSAFSIAWWSRPLRFRRDGGIPPGPWGCGSAWSRWISRCGGLENPPPSPRYRCWRESRVPASPGRRCASPAFPEKHPASLLTSAHRPPRETSWWRPPSGPAAPPRSCQRLLYSRVCGPGCRWRRSNESAPAEANSPRWYSDGIRLLPFCIGWPIEDTHWCSVGTGNTAPLIPAFSHAGRWWIQGRAWRTDCTRCWSHRWRRASCSGQICWTHSWLSRTWARSWPLGTSALSICIAISKQRDSEISDFRIPFSSNN